MLEKLILNWTINTFDCVKFVW